MRPCHDGGVRPYALALVGLFAGCAKLNAAFDESKSTGSGGETTTGTGDAPRPVTTDESTTRDAATTDDHATTEHSSTTDEAGTTGDPTSGSTDIGDSDIDPDEAVVVLLYAAEGWRGNAAALAPGAFGVAVEHCVDNPDYALACDPRIPALPVLRTSALPAENISPMDWAIEFGPIYGLHSAGDQPIAENIADLLSMQMLQSSLADAGVLDGPLAAGGLFWSGGRDSEVGNCDNWSTDANNTFAGAGTLLTPSDLDGDWFDVADTSCSTVLPILCACFSNPDPFG